MNKKIALVTGGTKGIGAAIAKKLKRDGFFVISNFGHDEETAQKFSKETDIDVIQWDLTDFDLCQKKVNDIESQYGSVSVLVNNAGITNDSMMHKMSYEQWKSVLETNLFSTFNMSRAVINLMRERQYGRIINIGSINGQKGQVGQVNYAASKSALQGFTKSLALESAKKSITVNLIAPGYTRTSMLEKMDKAVLDKIIDQIPVGRLAEAEDVSRCVSFLASDDASYITGATIPVNGGQFMF